MRHVFPCGERLARGGRLGQILDVGLARNGKAGDHLA
jgi:hypothetical protein